MDAANFKLASICCCCLAGEDSLRNMTKKDLDNYTTCSGLDLTGEPAVLICQNCANKLEGFNEFRALLLTSHWTLQNCLDADDIQVKEEVTFEVEEPTLVYQDQAPDSSLSLFNKGEANSVHQEEQQSSSQVYVQDKIDETEIKSESRDDLLIPVSDGDDELLAQATKRPLLDVNIENIEAKYMCFYCDTVISTYALYVKHRQDHKAQRRISRLERECTICGKYVKAYFRHIEKYHRDYKPNVCLLCPTGKFQDPNDLKRHLAIHTKVATLRCLACYKNIKSQIKLRFHIVNRHHSKDMYHCLFCGLGFREFLRLDAHFLAEHEKVATARNLFPCYACKRVYMVKNYFLAHKCVKNAVKWKATGSYKCDHCPATFDDEDELVCHQRTFCEDPSKFVCTTCGKKFNTRRDLLRHGCHGEVHVDKSGEFICNICGVATVTEFMLKLHKVSHKIDRSVFKMKQRLKNHKDLHKTQKFECDLCGRKFQFLHTIRKHMVKHVVKTRKSKTRTTESGPFACYFCDRSFMSARDRARHLNVHKSISVHNSVLDS